MSRPLRLLLAAPFPPRLDARHGGARAVAHLVHGMAARHAVGLVYFRASDEPPVDDALRAACAFVDEVPRATNAGPAGSRARRAVRLLAAPLGGTPTWAAAFADDAFAQRLSHRIDAWRPDLVQADFHVMAPYLAHARARGIPGVVVVHEPGAATAAEAARGAPWSPWRRLQTAAWRRFERDALAGASAVVAFTEWDRRALLTLAPGAAVERIPLAVPLPDLPAAPEVPGRLLFVGHFGHPPNRDAARRLVRRILPAVRQQDPNATLTLVGPQPPFASHPGAGLFVTGAVPDVAPYLAEAAVVVAPLHSGGGMRVKVLEALAAGKAVVATPRAAEGLGVTDGVHLVLATDDAAFAAAVAALLRDDERRRALGRQARTWAEAHAGIPAMLDAYDALYARLLAPS